MPFVLFIFFGFILLLICGQDEVRSRTKVDRYYLTHPQHKYQEEFLLACELYLQYRTRPTSSFEGQPMSRGSLGSPASREAVKDARLKMKDDGYLPSCYNSTDAWESWEESSWMLYRNDKPPYCWYDVDHIALSGFKECQKYDDTAVGFRFNNPLFKTEKDWKRYCYQMDRRFNELVDRYAETICSKRLVPPGPKINQEDPGYPLKYYKDNV